MSDHEQIWLEPKCAEESPEGRSWCDHDAWGRCDECGFEPMRFIRADIHDALAAENARLREAISLIAVVGFSDDPAVASAIARQTVTQARAALAQPASQ